MVLSTVILLLRRSQLSCSLPPLPKPGRFWLTQDSQLLPAGSRPCAAAVNTLLALHSWQHLAFRPARSRVRAGPGAGAAISQVGQMSGLPGRVRWETFLCGTDEAQ